jgi:hypothetical protein
MNFLVLVQPHPASPVKGKELTLPSPGGLRLGEEGLRAGDKMAIALKRIKLATWYQNIV